MTDLSNALEALIRPIVGIENRTAPEAFDIMVDRIRAKAALIDEFVHLTSRIAEVVQEDGGCWSACSGCQESVDGYVSSRDYPYSPIFKCQPGGGCGECGGLGVVWQDGDFLASYGDALDHDLEEPAADQLRDALAEGFCISNSAGHPDPAERSFRLIFSFGSLEALQTAHRIYVEGKG